jgi:hypothetical protein
MLCVFRALPRLIPQVMLTAPPASELVLISPWIEDVEISPPIVGSSKRWISSQSLRLSVFLAYLIENLDLTIYLVLRPPDERAYTLIRRVKRLSPNYDLRLIEDKYLHAKGIVTSSLVLQMSANLIFTSLYRNTENCTLSQNPYASVQRYMDIHLRTHL